MRPAGGGHGRECSASNHDGHTCASMWLASSGSAATVATALGHSESVLRKNYMALVTQAEAAKFWAL